MEIFYTPQAGLLIDPCLYSTVRASLVDIGTQETINHCTMRRAGMKNA